MPDTSDTSASSDNPLDLIGEIFSLVGLPNPLGAVTSSIDQTRRAAEGFITALDNFNRTMENLNRSVERFDRLLDDLEPALALIGPVVTKAADLVSSPTIASTPARLEAAVETLADLARRLAPLSAIIDGAGSLIAAAPTPTRRRSPKTPQDKGSADER
jgi:ABC-type transporter Mla subunit MlaD